MCRWPSGRQPVDNERRGRQETATLTAVTGNRAVPSHLVSSPFRRSDALATGVPVGLLRGPLFRSPFYGVRLAAELEQTMRMRAEAALLALPSGAVLSCHTSAGLRSLPVPAQATVHADIPVGLRGSRVRGVVTHVRDVPAVRVQGLPVTPPPELFLELANYLSLSDLVIVGDALVRRGWIKLDALAAAVGAVTRRRGVLRARRAVQLVRPGVDSPMETLVRLLMVLAGLPCPETGYRVIVDGHVIGWVDLALPAYNIVIEYDGDLHRTLKKKWRMDVATRDALRELGWTVIVLTWDDYGVTPTRTLGRIARHLALNGCESVPTTWRGGHVDRASLSAEWQAAFPGTARSAWGWEEQPAW